MKKLVTLLFIFGLLIFSAVGVNAESTELKSVDAILSEIRQEQSITSTDPIDISKVSSETLEELGDSVMEQIIGNTAMHERMDLALGGEGSTSLTNVHIRVGYDYLAGIPISMMTFMNGAGMMGGFGYSDPNGFYSGFGGMMGRFGYSNPNGFYQGFGGMMGGWGWIWMVVGTIGLIALIVGVIVLIVKASRTANQGTPDQAESILRERYARGEISQEDYLRMKNHLK